LLHPHLRPEGSRSFDGRASPLAEGVDGGGVAKFAGKIGEHGVEHLGLDGRGGVVIEVDAVHRFLLMMILDVRRLCVCQDAEGECLQSEREEDERRNREPGEVVVSAANKGLAEAGFWKCGNDWTYG